MLNRLKTPSTFPPWYAHPPRRGINHCIAASLEERPLNSPQERRLAECNASAKMRLKKMRRTYCLNPKSFVGMIDGE